MVGHETEGDEVYGFVEVRNLVFGVDTRFIDSFMIIEG